MKHVKNLFVFWMYSTGVLGVLFIMGLPLWVILYLLYWATA